MRHALRSVGASAKFTGSGGALVVLCNGGAQQAEQLRLKAEAEGYTLEELRVAAPY